MIQNIYYNSPEFKTLGDFLSEEGLSPAFSYKDNPRDFLLLKDESGISNFSKILNASSEEIKFDQAKKYNSGQFNLLELSPPILFSIDSKSSKSNLYSIQGNLVQNTFNVNYFISQNLAKIIEKGFQYKTLGGGIKITHPKLTVWLWSRSLSSSIGFSERGIQSNFELINLSPFIDQITTASTMEGSSFSFSLAAIKGNISSLVEGWKIQKKSVSFSKENGELRYNAISSMDDENLMQKDFFFHNIIQQNDLIFISYEDLPFETNEFKSEISVPFKAINSKIWDLIGLVDSNQLTVSKEGSVNVEINIAGRDLTKLIIEDGSYFWATEFGLDGTFRFAGNRDNRIAKRIGAAGFIDYYGIANKSIEYSLRFVLSQLANTGISPNYIFENYGDRRSTVFSKIETGRSTNTTQSNGNSFNDKSSLNIKIKIEKGIQENIADGVWAITKIIVDPQIANLRLVDAGLFKEQGSLINYINRICQAPFVEFYTETISDQFYWIARRPPHNRRAILGAIRGDFISDSNEFASSNQFNLGISLNSDGIANFETGTEEQVGESFWRTNSFVETINTLDTISFDLRFDERAYSWYKIESRYIFGGGDIESFALLPAIFIPTYTNLFGSRPLNISSNYVNYVPTTGIEDDENYSNALEQAYQDLAWLIETNSYLPFTRTGSIITNENRRIKKGMHVRLESTGEIFLVTSINHTFSISSGSMDRKTVLQVERGMVEDYIEGEEVEGYGKVSYFNLVDTPISKKRIRAKKKNEFSPIGLDGRLKKGSNDTVIANWKENEKVIDFFVRRLQFSKKGTK